MRTSLFLAAVLNGILAPPLIVIVLMVCNNAGLMGEHRNGWILNTLGVLTAAAMSAAAIVLAVEF